MRSREYWKSRAIALEYYAQQDATKSLNKINRLFGTALENIDTEIENIRQELGKQTGIVSENELNELLSAAERDKSYRELQELLDVAETAEERIDIMNRINAQAYGARITRADSIGNKILAEFTKAVAQEKILCKELFSSTYVDAFYSNIYNLAEGYNAGVAFNVLPRRAINKALNEPWNSDNYSGRIWKHGQEFTEQVEETIIKGLMTGRSRAKLASELMDYTEHTRYVAERLVRTETAHFLGEGQRKAYEAAGIEKYRYLAALSERTCEVCAALDNKVFPFDEATEGVNYPTMHPNCRCVTITADAKLSTRLARDPETGKNYKVDGNMDFQQWKDSLSDEQNQAFDLHVRQNKNKSSDKKQYDRYKARLGVENMPKTFDKFQELKYTDVETWKDYKKLYSTATGYIMGGTNLNKQVIVVNHIELRGIPNSITQIVGEKGGIDRNFYGADGKQFLQICNNDHGKPKQHPFGVNGEHSHDYIWDKDVFKERPAREMSADERKENGDIL